MRVYAESNFVLEVVLQQEEHQACERFMSLAAASQIELVLPASALLEPHETLVRRKKDWKAAREGINAHATQLARTAWISAETTRLRNGADVLLRVEQEVDKRFAEVRKNLCNVARLIPLDASTLRAAETSIVDYKLTPPDALMLAAVLVDAAANPTPSIFVNRNTQDFDDPDIKRRLKAVECRLIGSFNGGIGRVESALSSRETQSS